MCVIKIKHTYIHNTVKNYNYFYNFCIQINLSINLYNNDLEYQLLC